MPVSETPACIFCSYALSGLRPDASHLIVCPECGKRQDVPTCISCGYALTGLSRDGESEATWVQCPECGQAQLPMPVPRLPRAREALFWCSGVPVLMGFLGIPLAFLALEPFAGFAVLGTIMSMVIAPAIYSAVVERRATYHQRRRHIGLIVLLLGWVANAVLGVIAFLLAGMVL